MTTTTSNRTTSGAVGLQAIVMSRKWCKSDFLKTLV